MIVAGIRLGKSLLFQILPFIIKSNIVFMAIPILALIEN